MEASWWERGTEGQTGSCSDGQGHTHICTQCPWLCSRPLLTHASTGDSWTLTGKSGSVSCGVTAPLSWVLVPISFSLCPPRVCSQSCVSSGSSMAWLMLTSSKRAYAVPRSAAPRAPAPVAVHCWPVPPQDTLRHSSDSVSGVPGSWCTRFAWTLWASLVGKWFDSNVISPLLPFCWGFPFALGRGVSLCGGIQHFPVDSCSAVSCCFGVLAGDECTSFYSAIYATKVPLVSLIFLKRSLVFPILLFSSVSLHWSLRKAFLSLLVILWNSAFKWVYLSFSPLPLASLLSYLNCGIGEDSWESFGLQGDPTSQSQGSQPWIFFGRTDAEAETPKLWPPDEKN